MLVQSRTPRTTLELGKFCALIRTLEPQSRGIYNETISRIFKSTSLKVYAQNLIESNHHLTFICFISVLLQILEKDLLFLYLMYLHSFEVNGEVQGRFTITGKQLS